ncbi:acetate/propionate family kinase [Mycoplasma marinum]|uniref:Acetate kinase n=1 Tax=Mycoplasma marinum TaxID=1937190 RepID=A0A4R0XMT6_9MOLU|nr:acetate kinase [Mycoplasma marinum]TCG11860.1 acetate kinase [Mycoplasma marinum]
MDRKILIVNGGSSSLKFQVLKAHNKDLIASGMAERIEVDGIFTIKVNGEKFRIDKTLNNHKDAIALLMEELKNKEIIKDWKELVGVGHRIVQGGEFFKKSSLITKKELKEIRELAKLAPLHNPGEADIIEAFMSLLPNVPNVAVFDTSFHQTMEKEEFMYAVPNEWYTKYGVRRYGMHGTSHKYITKHMEEHLKKDSVNLIVCHLGNGSSLSAIRNSRVINTSMGLTPLAGLIMGTRSGDLDPAIVSYMSGQLNKDANYVVDLLNHESGLKALSGISSDMRDIRDAADKGDERAQFTIRSFSRRIATYIVDYANQIGEKLDGIVFTAGIGENSKEIREAIISEVKILGLELCDERNGEKYEDILLISDDSSKIPLFAVRTNEEIMIANDLLTFIK